jgi:hypothetical protein
MKPKRSFELKLLMVILLLAGWFGALRIARAWHDWNWLILFDLPVHPLYFILSGAVWAAGGFGSALGLWLRLRWAPLVTRLTAVVCAAWYWVESLVFPHSPLDAANRPFAAVMTAVLLGYIFGTLALPRQVQFFQGELRQENQ